MIFFGLTGGIASGKSTVAKRIAERGIPVVDADAVAREVVLPGQPAFEEIVGAFGQELLQADGQLNRKRIGEIVFGDPEKRKMLNAIIHPRIGMRTAERAEELRAAGTPVACYEAALLVENGLVEAFRPLVVVGVSLALQVERLRARDRYTAEEALARIGAQFPLAQKIAAADFVIDTDGSFEDVERRTDGVVDAILGAVPSLR